MAGNLFEPCPQARAAEVTERLAGGAGVRVERIVSHGQASPPGFWYEQAEDEWVAVLSGRARLDFGDGGSRDLAPGDHVLLPAGLRHRVGWTDPAQPTVWLAVFWAPEGRD